MCLVHPHPPPPPPPRICPCVLTNTYTTKGKTNLVILNSNYLCYHKRVGDFCFVYGSMKCLLTPPPSTFQTPSPIHFPAWPLHNNTVKQYMCILTYSEHLYMIPSQYKLLAIRDFMPFPYLVDRGSEVLDFMIE